MPAAARGYPAPPGVAAALAALPTVVQSLRRWAAATPDAPYLTAVAADGTAATLTYGELAVRTAALAHRVRHTLGIPPGSVVGLVPGNDAPSVLAILGLLRAGCPVLFLGPADPPGRLRELLAGRRAVAVLQSPRLPDRVLPEAVVLPEPAGLPAVDWSDAPADPDGDALLFGTSGSTAASKVVAQCHRNASVNAEAVRRHHRLGPGDRLLGCLPVHHVNGVHLTLLATLHAGAHAVLAQSFSPFGYPRLLDRFRPRIASVVPSILEALLDSWRRPELPPGFGYFVSAAAPLPARTAREVAARWSARVVQGYGLTETTNFATTMPVGLTPAEYDRLVLAADVPPVGVALLGNEVTVRDPAGRRVDPGGTGEVCVRGHTVMSRYAGNPAATAEAFRGGWFHTGDLGVQLDGGPAGTLLVLTGRSKNIAKVGAESVSLEEMERVLRAVPGVRDAACVSVPHPLLGEEILAAVVPAGPVVPDLMAPLGTVFAAAVLPRRVTALAQIPRTATGKLRRAELADRLTGAAGGGDAG